MRDRLFKLTAKVVEAGGYFQKEVVTENTPIPSKIVFLLARHEIRNQLNPEIAEIVSLPEKWQPGMTIAEFLDKADVRKRDVHA